ncbi:hypothetical protein Fcan01_16958 [Folsomia candida]|uniref:Uncharacterized protein n=2 Tax=Folsomia candida TaxID=158441 RepID=A0A226DW25_FOLCA|nr:hypothetical protein Fcan01_16958 [Folsomia candida]
MVLGNITHLEIWETHDPSLLEELKTAFPNLVKLEVITCEEMDTRWDESGMELGVVLNACGGGWGAPKHLYIELPSYPDQIKDTIQVLVDTREMFVGLKTLEIGMMECENPRIHNLAENELDLFKQLLIALDEVDLVSIHDLYFGKETLRNILHFLESSKMYVSKFKMFQDGLTLSEIKL